MRTVLGLDLGTSSVGWALFEADDNGLPINLIDLGVRHFEEVVEPKSKLPKNANRRQARAWKSGHLMTQRGTRMFASLRMETYFSNQREFFALCKLIPSTWTNTGGISDPLRPGYTPPSGWVDDSGRSKHAVIRFSWCNPNCGAQPDLHKCASGRGIGPEPDCVKP
jgi:hypothetical protein